MDVLLTIVLSVCVFISFLFVLRKRRQQQIVGWRSFLPSLALYSIAILQMFAYWFGFLGVISFALTIILLTIGAYFTKYLPREKWE